MRIGVPKEIKIHEYRVGLTPASVTELVAHGHQVIVATASILTMRIILPQVRRLLGRRKRCLRRPR
jgi:hypothetical protein